MRRKSILISACLLVNTLWAKPPFPFCDPDLFIKEQDTTFEALVLQRRQEITALNQRWRAKLTPQEFPTGHLVQESVGTYILYDSMGLPRFVIKPVDEDLLCLHNKIKASCLDHPHIRTRRFIPPYCSAQNQALSFAVATLLHLDTVTPPTFLALLSHPQFFDCNDLLQEPIGIPSREKLCAVQHFWPHIENLHDLAYEWLKSGFTDEELLTLIDQESFEDLCLFIWLIYDTDAHAGNLFAQRDEQGRYHLCKLDNALCFPERNEGLLNALYFLPNAKCSPSERLLAKLEYLEPRAISELFIYYDREDALYAFWQRVTKLKRWLRSGMTFRQIDSGLR